MHEALVEDHIEQPTFITQHPTEVSPLARRNDANPFVTDRFEFFVGGREIANAYDLDYVDPAEVAPLPAEGEALPVTIDAGTGVQRFGLRPVTGIDPHAVSPWWMQRRLLLSGIRAISPAVDVTNYVMLELGHPMHAHDRGLISGGFRVRFAEPGETVVTLDDVERTLDPADVLIVACELLYNLKEREPEAYQHHLVKMAAAEHDFPFAIHRRGESGPATRAETAPTCDASKDLQRGV